MTNVDGYPRKAEFSLVRAKNSYTRVSMAGGKSDAGTSCEITDSRGYLEHEISTLVGDDKAHFRLRLDHSSSSEEEIDPPSFIAGNTLSLPRRRIILPASYTKNPEHKLMNRLHGEYLLIQG